MQFYLSMATFLAYSTLVTAYIPLIGIPLALLVVSLALFGGSLLLLFYLLSFSREELSCIEHLLIGFGLV